MSRSDFDPRRFRTTVPFYARHRLAYPDALIARVAQFVGLKPGDAVMDLGCGPGLLAVPFARLGMTVVAIDPEPDMVAACRVAAEAAGVAIDVRQASSFSLPADIGPFRLVTMGRSFHWMDRAETLRVLDGLVAPDGAVALFGDDHPPTAENAWLRTLNEVAMRYGRADAPHIRARAAAGFRTHESVLFDSAFRRLSGLSEYVRRTITADDVVGLAFSQSPTAPEKLGERAGAFEAELRAALAALAPDGRFTEIGEVFAQVARR